MGIRCAGLVAVLAGLFLWPSVCLAGMPTPVLTDWAVLRLSSISFFAAVVLSAAAGVRWLWNSLASDFPLLPRLSYRKTLAAVVLWGLALAVVLTMIAGARELLTPGAWQKEGLLYKLPAAERPAPPPPAPDADRMAERRENLHRLQLALWQYAARHDGRFPASIADSKLAAALWEVPGGAGMQYLYVGGRKAGPSGDILAWEPSVHGDQRLVLFADGRIALAPSSEIRDKLR
jgi:hypothetical protein